MQKDELKIRLLQCKKKANIFLCPSVPIFEEYTIRPSGWLNVSVPPCLLPSSRVLQHFA